MNEFISELQQSVYLLPLASLLIGLAGSTHCLTMCGGISLACTDNSKSKYLYQIGRLFGYMALGVLAKLLGQIFDLSFFSSSLSHIAGVLIGITLIFFGLKNVKNSKFKIKLPTFLEKRSFKLWKRLIDRKKDHKTVFAIGFLTILLPCGLIYSIVIPLIAIDSIIISIITIFTFWLGTLPVMSIAPLLISKLLDRVQGRASLLVSFTLVLVGLLTISNRISKLNEIPEFKSPDTLICK